MTELYLSINSRVAGKKYEVSQILTGAITWTTERIGTAGKLSFTLIKVGDIVFHEGDQVRCKVDGVSIFLGYVFTKDKSQEKITVTCYDMLRYLKAKQSYLVKQMTAGDVVKQVAADFNLTVGTIADTGLIMDKKRYESQTLLDMITDCLYQTQLKTGTVYNLYDDSGRLTVQKAADMSAKVPIGTVGALDERTITDYTYKTSIDNDTYNVVKLVRPNADTGRGDVYSSEDDSVAWWGKLQYYEKVDEKLEVAAIRDRVKYLLDYFAQVRRTLKLSALGNTAVRAGCMLEINMPDLGDVALHKKLLVNKCTQKISSNAYTMDLEMIVENG